MAEDRRMTAAQVVDKVMGSEHVDVVRESVAWLVGELMEAEVSAQIGAGLGEVSPERVTHRSGYRSRPLAALAVVVAPAATAGSALDRAMTQCVRAADVQRLVFSAVKYSSRSKPSRVGMSRSSRSRRSSAPGPIQLRAGAANRDAPRAEGAGERSRV